LNSVAIDPHAVTSLAATGENPCSTSRGYPYLKLWKVLHKRLGGIASPTGPLLKDQNHVEGLFYEAKDITSNELMRLEMHAIGPYYPASPGDNGFDGEFGTVNLQAGTEVRLNVSLKEVDTNAMVSPLSKVELTFFDLDTGKDGSGIESITVDHVAKYTLTEDTEVDVFVNDATTGSVTFTGTTEGDGADNPADPLTLTAQQRNRAVTVEFHDFTTCNINFKVTGDSMEHYFYYSGRPGVVCAAISEPGGTTKKPVSVEAPFQPSGATTWSLSGSASCLVLLFHVLGRVLLAR